MAIKDALGNRMKKNYENITRSYLPRRIPVIIRLDGKSFHTFTKGMKKPFDNILTMTMQDTMKYLCEHIQGCVLGYTQSDEITLVLTDYATIKTDAWFDYNVQKMASIAASMATLAFNLSFIDNVSAAAQYYDTEATIESALAFDYSVYERKFNHALFDARAFSVPKEEVCNCMIWRQQDATRNSIEAVGQAYFPQKNLHKKTQSDIQEMLWSQFGINWNDFAAEHKRGSCCRKITAESQIDDPRNPGQKITVTRRKWIIDKEIPIFTQDRMYIERLI